MKKRILAALLCVVMVLSMTACGSKKESESVVPEVAEDATFDELVEAAKGTTVTFYGWGGNDDLNAWLDDYFAPRMKEKYDITMERVPMNIEDILSQLQGEITA